MKKNLYEKNMQEVYDKLYPERHNFNPKLIEYEKKKIEKNIKEMGLKISDLKKMCIFNTGTGLESIIFHELGAKKIYHYDISDTAVGNLNHLRNTNPKFHNLYSEKINLVEDKLSTPEGIDLVYLQGVAHHFSECKKGLENIFSNLNKDARIFMRNYRTGTLIFFVADFIRKFINYDCMIDFDKVCHERFGDFPSQADWTSNLYTNICGLSFDHFFVPTLHLHDTKELNNYFESNGFQNLLPQTVPEYNHGNFTDSAQTNTSFVYAKMTDRTDKFDGKFPEHIDQLSDITYREKYIIQTVEMMKKALPKLKTISNVEKIKLAVELFFIADTYRFIKFYLNGKHNIDEKKFELLSSVEGIHYLFQKELENY